MVRLLVAFALLCLPAAAAAGIPADNLTERMRHAKDTAVTTGKAAADAARQAAETARAGVETAKSIKRAADDSGLTGLVVDAGKGAVRRGINSLKPEERTAEEQQQAAVADEPKPQAQTPAATPRPATKPTNPRIHREPIHLNSAVVRVLAAIVAAIGAILAVACAVISFRARRTQAARDKVILATLQPIFASDAPLRPTQPAAKDSGFEFAPVSQH
ncbi:hypothetical protein T492DRAFT_951398 [Pavlovales sp. CCMP2436]|nr:hypothetical protein T492DRAFT_951398 [Pavlovales sp. CCMP2436]|mmetsp:Transcript_18363/g.42763  ORF Transcript_18363/g.42763 Transcript_18363/m.42763 type:complete len:217 (-) Transcript_18363:303-953(-)